MTSFYKDTAEFIKKYEGFSPTAQWDVNAWRIGHGSDTITYPNGTIKKVVQTDTTTRELAQLDLERRIKQDFEPRVKTQIGPNYDKLPGASKTALISISYNYGRIPTNEIINAARSLSHTNLANAIVDSTINHNRGTPYYDGLRNRRKAEANYILANYQKKYLNIALPLILGIAAYLMYK